MTDNTTPDPACSLTARAFQERVAWIAALNQEFLRRSQRQGNLLTLTYDAAARLRVEDMVSRERDCCAFLEFKIISAGEEVVLNVTVPTHATENADKLLAPFLGDQMSAAATECCGACDVPASPVKAGRVAGTAVATSTAAVVACGACCVLPLAFPAVAATAVGGALAWLGGVHLWVTGLAALTAVGAALDLAAVCEAQSTSGNLHAGANGAGKPCVGSGDRMAAHRTLIDGCLVLLTCQLKTENDGCNPAQHSDLSALRSAVDRGHAHRRLLLLFRVRCMWADTSSQGRRLLCVLLLRQRAVPADSTEQVLLRVAWQNPQEGRVVVAPPAR